MIAQPTKVEVIKFRKFMKSKYSGYDKIKDTKVQMGNWFRAIPYKITQKQTGRFRYLINMARRKLKGDLGNPIPIANITVHIKDKTVRGYIVPKDSDYNNMNFIMGMKKFMFSLGQNIYGNARTIKLFLPNLIKVRDTLPAEMQELVEDLKIKVEAV